MPGGKLLQKGKVQYSPTFHRFNIIIYQVWPVLGDESGLAGKNYAWEVNIVIGNVVDDVCIEFVMVTAALILCCSIIANDVALFFVSLVEHLSIDVQESPVLQGEMWNWIFTSGHSCFKVVHSIDLIEPCSKFAVSDSRTAIVIKLNHFELIGHKMGSNVGCYGCA